MPDMYPPGEYDLAGFAVGVVEKSGVIDGRAIRPGDVVLGLASSGVHSNGYSLVRRIVERAHGALDTPRMNDDFHGTRFADAVMARVAQLQGQLIPAERVLDQSHRDVTPQAIALVIEGHQARGFLPPVLQRMQPQVRDVGRFIVAMDSEHPAHGQGLTMAD